MTEADAIYVRRLMALGQIKSPCLELGVGYGGSTCKPFLTQSGMKYYGTDMQAGTDVDFVADFESPPDELTRAFQAIGEFATILILNVLEHCFDPIRVLDNAARLLKKGGNLVLLTPAIWPLHDYPRDCWRINPNFYEEYARRRGFDLLTDLFEYIGLGNVTRYKEASGNYQFPRPSQDSSAKAFYSRAVHKVMNTFGRGMQFPSHIAIGAVLQK